MGTWNITMPLLSTLAALIIIVHSLDEGMEKEPYNDRRGHNVGPRSAEQGSHQDYDQAWRALEVEPIKQQEVPVEQLDETAPQETLKRRRPGRKRKRRLHTQQQEDIQEERKLFVEDSHRPNREPDDSGTFAITERSRRRKKKTDLGSDHWNAEDREVQRFPRRRVQRKRQPERLDDDRLDEFVMVDQDQDDELRPVFNLETSKEHNRERIVEEEHSKDTESFKKKADKKIKGLSQPRKINKVISFMDVDERFGFPEKSLSEFSEETLTETPRYTTTGANNYKHQKGLGEQYYDGTFEEHLSRLSDQYDTYDIGKSLNSVSNVIIEKDGQQKAKSDEKLRGNIDSVENQNEDVIAILNHASKILKKGGIPVDAASLKELLKQSGSTSLSEILQQRNLSLSDLLNGKENAISVLQRDSVEFNHQLDENPQIPEDTSTTTESVDMILSEEKVLSMRKAMEKIIIPEDPIFFTTESTPISEAMHDNDEKKVIRISHRRRIQPGTRRRQRIKGSSLPTLNFISLHPGRRTYMNKRNVSTLLEDLENVDIINKSNQSENISNEPLTITEAIFTASTIEYNDSANCNNASYVTTPPSIYISNTDSDSLMNTTLNTREKEISIRELPQEILHTEKTESVTPHKRPKLSATNLELRRQALTNRLKKKRLQQKNLTVDLDEMNVKDLFGMANLVSASEFIAKTQIPEATEATTMIRDEDHVTKKLEDVTMPDRITNTDEILPTNVQTTSKLKSPVDTSVLKKPLPPITEEKAKVEIDEILNDSNTSARLSKILSERNMTINELVEHRERGSSQVHLADIFHNTSKEPNPPEPFLSKSLIEPISKETYPLRALLEANHHDPAVKVQTPFNIQYDNIPLVMDFGNNVNENGENLGIVSLFNKFNNTVVVDSEKKKLKIDSEGTPYFTSVATVNATNETNREGRVLDDNVLNGLKEIFTNLKRYNQKVTQPILETSTKEITHALTTETVHDVQDLDGDGLIILEDLQQLNDLDNTLAQISKEKLEVKIIDEQETTTNGSGLLEKIPSNTRSVTIATASITGITMVLFLLTYIGCKWRHQRNSHCKKDNFDGERIPTPVFENRKMSKMNSSNRSISPMLSSNIYTMSTLDSRNGQESPDYMWDSLRKPFQ